MKITKDLFSQNYELKSFHFPAERKKAGLVKMCRVGGEVECREVSVAWVRDMEEEWDGEGAQRDRDAAPRRQDLGDVNEGHCEGRRTEREGGRARMETSNGKPKLPLPFLPSSLFVVVVVFFLSFSLTHSPLPS